MWDKIKKFFKENYKLMLVTFLIGIFAHGFTITNKLISHDEIFYSFGKGTSFSSGRWGLELISFIFPNISMPWYNGVLTLAILSISFCLTLDILNIKNKYFRVLICGVLMTFPAMASTFAFTYTITAYSISIFLSIISVAFLRSEKPIFNVFGIITIILSVGIYQAYICITMIMLIMLLIMDCKDENKNAKKIIYNCIKYIVFIAVALILYLVITKGINHMLNIRFSKYRGFDSMGIFTIKEVIDGILSSYHNILKLFSNSVISDTFGTSEYMKNLTLITIVFSIILILVRFVDLIKKKNIAKAILMLILFLLQPIALDFIAVVNPKIGILYSVMIYQYAFVIIEPIVLCEYFNIKSKKIKKVIYMLFIIIIFQFATVANEFHFRLCLGYENIYSFYDGLIDRIEKMDGYDKSMPVLFIGNYSGELNTNYHDYFNEIVRIGGSFENYTLEPEDGYRFLKYFIGVNLKYNIKYEHVKKEDINDIMQLNEYKEMNVYPYNNSIKEINGIIVVKFSD